MSINISQNNNNYGNGIQYSIINNNYSQKNDKLKGLLEKLEETKSDLSKEQKDCVDELINIIDSTKREDMIKPLFVSRFTTAWNKIHELLITGGTLISDTKFILTILEEIKELIEGFWK